MFQNSFIKVLSSFVASFCLQALYFVFLARSLGATEFGLWAGAYALVLACANLVGLGAGNTVVVWGVRDRKTLRIQVGTSLIYIAISVLPMAFFAGLVGVAISHQFYQVLLPLLLSELFALRLADLSLQIFQADGHLGRNSICRIAGSISRVLLVLAFHLIGNHQASQWSWVYAGVTIIVSVTTLIWAVLSVGKPLVSRTSLMNTWRTGIFFALGMSSRQVQAEGDKYALNIAGLTSAAGQLSIASRLVAMAFAPVQALVYSKNAALFKAGSSGNRAVEAEIKQPLKFVFIIGGASSATLFILAPVVAWVLGPSYIDSIELIRWLSPLVLVNGIYYLYGDALMGMGRQGIRSLAQGTIALTSLGLNLYFVPIYGLQSSVAIALGSSVLLMCTVCLIFRFSIKNS